MMPSCCQGLSRTAGWIDALGLQEAELDREWKRREREVR